MGKLRTGVSLLVYKLTYVMAYAHQNGHRNTCQNWYITGAAGGL